MDIQKVITEGVEIYSKTSDKPVVIVLNGIEGVKAVYMDTLSINPEEPIYAFLNPEATHDELYKWLDEVYVKERVRKGISAHVFISNKHESKSEKYVKTSTEEKRIVQYIEDFGIPFECEVDIYGDRVALINYNPKGDISGIIINHPIIAATIKSLYLHLLWKL